MTRTPDALGGNFLPDFCRMRALLPLLTISQLVAVILVLATHQAETSGATQLVLISLYLHWITLCSAAALCRLRRRVPEAGPRAVAALSLGIVLGLTLLFSELAWQLSRWLGTLAPQGSHAGYLLRSVTIAAIVITLALRYFYVQHAWRRQVQASAEARFAALQSRIRPHFLFNSLNSIAALIPGRPQQAEGLVEDLAELYHAVLRADRPLAPLDDEIELTRAYLRIEQLRLDERLAVQWAVDEDVRSLPVPVLSLQPLVENAVFHGIESRVDGGCIEISARRSGRRLRIRVGNPLPQQDRREDGEHLALSNIRQRLRLLYDDQASLTTRRAGDTHFAELDIPVS